jgi:hypothetical protein
MDEPDKTREWVLKIDRRWYLANTIRKTLLACFLYLCIVAALIWFNYSEIGFDRHTWIGIGVLIFVPVSMMCVMIPRADRNRRYMMVLLLYDHLMLIPFNGKSFEFDSDNPLLITRSSTGRYWIVRQSHEKFYKARLPVKAFPGFLDFIRNVLSEIGQEKITINESPL